MKCVKCNENGIPFIKIWIKSGYGHYKCDKCAVTLKVKKNYKLVFVPILLGTISTAIGIYYESWAVFFAAFLVAITIDAIIDTQILELELIIDKKEKRQSFSKFIYKPTVMLSAIVVLIISTFCIYSLYKYYYPKLNNDAVQFLIKEKQHIPHNKNAIFSIVGLNAPADTIDIHAYGIDLVNKILGEDSGIDSKYIDVLAEFPEIENELTFEGEIKKVLCWLDEKPVHKTTNENQNMDTCYTYEELNLIVNKNRILLNRHDELKKYTEYDGFVTFGRNAPLLINTHRLYLAHIRLDLYAGNQEALKRLIDDLKYFRTLMNQPSTFVTKAIFMVLYSLSLEQLEYSIKNHTDISLNKKAEIDNILSNMSNEEFNLDGLIREEFEMINSIFCLDENLGISTPDYCYIGANVDSISINYIINDFYDFYLNYKYILGL
ncbi:MAG: hypothetical protein ACPHLK_06750, partial [Gammaproteobacteria bacterium]